MWRPILCLAALTFVVPALAQSPAGTANERPNPLQVIISQTQMSGPDGVVAPAVAVDIQNASSGCVIGFVLKTGWIDSAGNPRGQGSATHFRHKTEGGFKCLNPGESYHLPDQITAIDKSGKQSTFHVDVDFVLFVDGTSWGPGTLASEKDRMLERFHQYTDSSSKL